MNPLMFNSVDKLFFRMRYSLTVTLAPFDANYDEVIVGDKERGIAGIRGKSPQQAGIRSLSSSILSIRISRTDAANHSN